MSDLRQTIRKWREGLTLLGFEADNVNWQAVAVLLDNLPDKRGDIRSMLTRDGGGWTTFGHSEGDDGTSLYLSPKGLAYWLRYGGHYSWYDGLLNLPQQSLDRAGWLHISGGRVDVQCRITPAQQRWLDAHKPCPGSVGARDGDWKIKPYEHNSLEAAPIPFAPAERYDIRPVTEDIETDAGWDRLMLRIQQARHRNAGTE